MYFIRYILYTVYIIYIYIYIYQPGGPQGAGRYDHMFLPLRMNMCLYVYIHIDTHMFEPTWGIYIYIYIHACIEVYMYACVYAHVYIIYIYICIYMLHACMKDLASRKF